MNRDRPKFAIVREDPEVEATLVARYGIRHALVVASGGCTLLTLAARFPRLLLAAFDFNPAQIALVRSKVLLATAPTKRDWSDPTARSLNENGEFEGLFRTLRAFLAEFVWSEFEFGVLFDPATDPAQRRATIEAGLASPYWPRAFALAFDHDLLDVMFTSAATQHAAPGSYPAYFQAVFERTLRRVDAHRNPFLQHALLGNFIEAPEWLGAADALAGREFEFCQGGLLDAPEIERFDLIHLSNIFDWSDATQIDSWCQRLRERARAGAIVVVRQLNNQTDLMAHLGNEFEYQRDVSAELTGASRIQFYNRIVVARRRS